MKVYIGPYKSFFGPYQIASKILFWLAEDHDLVYKLGRILEKTWIADISNRFYEKYGNQKVKVKIDDYDVWSADYTLAHIILPILKKIKEDKYGVPYVSNEDVPEELRIENDDDFFNDHSDEKWELQQKRWNYILDEIIFAFESYFNDWQDQFHSGEMDREFIPIDNEGNQVSEEECVAYTWEKTDKDTSEFDVEGHREYQKRIDNGLILFGKYYQALWT